MDLHSTNPYYSGVNCIFVELENVSRGVEGDYLNREIEIGNAQTN